MSLPRIYIIGKAWSPRALIRAELIEDGLDVMARETVEEVLPELRRRLKPPDLILIDYSDTRLDPARLDPLQALRKKAPVLLCVSGPDRALAQAAGFRCLARPFSVRTVIDEVRALLASHRSEGPEGAQPPASLKAGG